MKTTKSCTQCGSCLNTCPVFRLYKSEEYSPKAKQELIAKGWTDDSEFNWEKMIDIASQCACCERCKPLCARRLSVPEALGQARARHPRWQQYFWREWVKRGKLLWKTASHLAPIVPNSLLPEKLGIMHAAALAMKAPESPAPWLVLQTPLPQKLSGQKMVVFGGCTATRLRQNWLEKAKTAVNKLGGTICDDSGFVCCGGTFEHAGMLEAATDSATQNISYWKSLGKPKILVLCASCMHSLKHYAEMENLLSEEDKKVWLDSLIPLSQIFDKDTLTVTRDAPKKYAYHSPCHWGNKDADMLMLSSVLGGMQKGAEPCCGFGGVLKMLNPTLSKDLAETCWRGLTKNSDNIVALTSCSGCTLQLSAHAPEGAKIYHWLDVLQV